MPSSDCRPPCPPVKYKNDAIGCRTFSATVSFDRSQLLANVRVSKSSSQIWCFDFIASFLFAPNVTSCAYEAALATPSKTTEQLMYSTRLALPDIYELPLVLKQFELKLIVFIDLKFARRCKYS